MGKSSINGPSIAMATLNNQRVYIYTYRSKSAAPTEKIRFFQEKWDSKQKRCFFRWEEREPA